MILYLDTETTGLHPGNVCQLSYVMQTKDGVTAKNMFFTVDYVEYGAYMVHGFSVEKLESLSFGKRFKDRIDEIESDFMSADVIVSHNTSFDFMFLGKEFERLGKVFSAKASYCSMKKMTPVCKLKRANSLGYKYPKLNELCAYFSVSDYEILEESQRIFGDKTGYHDARFDTTAVYLAMNRAFESGIDLKEIKDYL